MDERTLIIIPNRSRFEIEINDVIPFELEKPKELIEMTLMGLVYEWI